MKIDTNKILVTLYSILFVFTPLVMFHRTSELFEFNKMLVIYLMTGIIASAWIARMLIAKQIILRNTVLLLPVLLFFASQVLSTIFSIDIQTSLFGYYGRFNGGLLSIAAYIILVLGFISNVDTSTRRTVRTTVEKLLLVSLITSVLVMLWGLPSRFGYDPTCLVFTGNLNVDCWTAQFQPTIRMFSTLGQPNWLGAYLAIHIFIALYFFFRYTDKIKLILIGCYLAAGMTTILFSRSRSALLAVFVGTVLTAGYIALRRNRLGKSLVKKLTASALLILIPILLLGSGIPQADRFIHIPEYFMSEQEVQESTETAPVSFEQDITGSGEIRQIVWQGAYNLGLEFPVFGTGVETFAYSYNFLRPRDHNATTEWDFVYNKAHNEFFNYFATTGIIGLGTYLLLIAIVLYQYSHILRGTLNEKDEPLIFFLLTAFMTILVTNFLGFSTTTIQLFFYLIPAWVVLVIYSPSIKKYAHMLTVHDSDYKKLIPSGIIILVSVIYIVLYLRADMYYARADGMRQAQRYAEALEGYYRAFSIRKEHVYADKISQTLAQIALIKKLSGQQEGVPQCPDRNGTVSSCIDLSEFYADYAIAHSSKNAFYYRTKARNTFIFYQITGDEAYFNEAARTITQARALAPTDPRYPYLRALFELGKYELTSNPSEQDKTNLEAFGVGTAQFAIELKNDYADAYYILGLVQKELGNRDAARKAFTTIVEELNPNHEEAKKELQEL